MTTLQIIGGGRMGEALLAGLLASGSVEATELRVVEIEPARRDALRSTHGVDVGDSPASADGTVIATKPPLAAEVARQVTAAGGGRILSVAAGVTTATLEAAAGDESVVVRAMPNTPALVGRGASCIAAGSRAGDVDLEWAEGVLGAVGTVHRVAEPLLDAVTGLSGSGPAYIFLVAEALTDAGVAAGLPRELASALTNQTLLGAAAMLVDTGAEPSALRAAVTSPGGTTAAGLTVLERAAVRAAFVDAVAAATGRSRELSAS